MMKLNVTETICRCMLAAVILSFVGCESGKTASTADQLAVSDESAMMTQANDPSAAEAPPSTLPPTTAPSPPQSAEPEQGRENRLIDCGTVRFGSGRQETSLPLYCVEARRAVSDPTSSVEQKR